MARSRTISPDPALLGLLMVAPKHGYELHQEFERELGWVWEMGRSQLYAGLRQLAEQGLVDVHEEPQAKHPPRKVYHITPSGREMFLSWLRQPTPYLNRIRLELLARLYFFRRLELDGVEQLVAAQKAICHTRADSLASAAAEEQDAFRRLVLQFRQGQVEAVIGWLHCCLEAQ